MPVRTAIGVLLALVITACSVGGGPTAAPSPRPTAPPSSPSVAPGCAPGSPAILGTPVSGARGPTESGSALAELDPAVISPATFGLHQSKIGSQDPKAVPCAHFGAIRLWDSATSWRHVEPADDTWDFSVLDRAVENITSHGGRPLIVFGQTPQWAASVPTAAGYYGPGASSMPRSLAEWREYVTAVVTRYQGKVSEYEVWNEPNVLGFWAGSEAQMAVLARETYDVVKALDPEAILTTPSFVVRRPAQQSWFGRYLQTGAARYADVVNIHLYPPTDATPEDLIGLMDYPRRMLAANGVRLPVWNTEVNYGLPTGGVAVAYDLPPDVAQGYVLRTFLLAAHLRIDRSYWYGWDPPLGILLSTPDGTPTPAGQAFSTSYEWLTGSRFRGCSTDASNTWTCSFSKSGSTYRYVWNPQQLVTMPAPAGTKAVLRLSDGSQSARPARPAAQVEVGPSPVAFVLA